MTRMSILLLLMTVAPAVPDAEAWFYPGRGPDTAVIAEDSTINGLPVQLTGHLLARAEDPDAIRSLDEVADVQVLPGDGHVVRIQVRDGVDEVALSRTLRDRSDVVWSHPDLAMERVPHVMPDDPFVDDQWHLVNTGQSGWTPGVDINAEAAWAVSSGEGGTVAVLDSGCDLDHPDLDVIGGWDYVGNDSDSSPEVETDEAPHGTCAAGLAAATGDNGIGVAGVAYDSQVYAIRLIGGMGDLEDVYTSFVEAVDAGAWVLSNSWGWGDDCPAVEEYDIFVEAFEYAEAVGRDGLGAAVVLSAGNGNCDMTNDGFQAQPTAISVAATTGNDERESYSSYGAHMDVSAPSGGVLTTDISGDDGYGSWEDDPDYYGYFSGTSASAPIVSGTLALMFAANPHLTAAEAREVLCETAVRMDVENGGYDEDGWSMYYGCGRVDAGAAVLAVANELPGAPEIVGPGDEAGVERVVLQWEQVEDADGDALSYDVSWWVGWNDPTVVAVNDDQLDITGQVTVGATVSWSVQAVDSWGAGEPSEERSFEVVGYELVIEAVTLEGEGGGCAIGGATRTAGWLAAGILVLVLASRNGSQRRSGHR